MKNFCNSLVFAGHAAKSDKSRHSAKMMGVKFKDFDIGEPYNII